MAKKDARNTKGRIVDAAWSLFYEKGYEGTTIEESVPKHPKALSTTISTARTPCSPPSHTCLTPNTNSSCKTWIRR